MFSSNRFHAAICLFLVPILTSLVPVGLLVSRAGARTVSPLAEEGWSSTGGPWDASGDARLFAVDTEAEHTGYAVVESSGISTLYRTQDDGATWTSRFQFNKRLGALVARGGVLYAGVANATAGEAAILRSEDGGATWEAVMSAADATTVNFFDLAPSPSAAAYAAATVGGSGLVLSSADGLAWATRYSISGQMIRVAVNPADGDNVFAAGQDGATDQAQVYRTVDGGDQWVTVLSVAGEGIQDFLQVHPVTPSYIFVSIRPRGCCPPQPANLWRSEDGGDTWSVITTGYLFNLYFALPDSIYSIFDAVSVTHDASSPNPTWIDRGVPFSEWVHGRAVDARPTNPVIYAGLWMSGIFVSTDDAQTFHDANAGIHSLLRANALATDPQSATTLYAATDKGVFRSDDSGDSWSSTFPRIITRDVAVQPGNSNMLLVSVEDASVPYPTPSPLVYRSQDGGLSWTLVFSQTGEPARSYGACGVAFDPSEPNLAFVTTCTWTPAAESNNHLLRSPDGGLTWEDIQSSHGQGGGVVVIEIAADRTVYWGGKEGMDADGRAILYRSDDHGDNWSEVYSHDLDWRVLSLSLDPQTPASLTMIVSENEGSTHLLQSDDRGDTWRELYPPPHALGSRIRQGSALQVLQNLQVITHDPLTPGRLFLGASGPVVLMSNNNGQTWSEVGGWEGGSLAPDVSALAVSHSAEERILFASLGGIGTSGVWRRAVPPYQVFLPLVMRNY